VRRRRLGKPSRRARRRSLIRCLRRPPGQAEATVRFTWSRCTFSASPRHLLNTGASPPRWTRAGRPELRRRPRFRPPLHAPPPVSPPLRHPRAPFPFPPPSYGPCRPSRWCRCWPEPPAGTPPVFCFESEEEDEVATLHITPLSWDELIISYSLI
jgi:hypothetical protein